MKIRNYTSSVPSSESQRQIEKLLVEFGAQKISKTYLNGKVVAMVFELPLPGPALGFVPVRIPARADEVAIVLKREVPALRNNADRLRDQSERTAWKLMLDWVHLQLSLISMRQVQPLEVFLPYVYDPRGNRTFYESLESGNFKALTAPQD